ncbi:MAG TPA: hypothetical protein VEH81_05230 [Ktedonobacteraceae bacterium]|nr:hypothetical protein [Ktedonobacteraceae bacterium]
MKLVTLLINIPRRFAIFATLCLLALGILVPTTAFAAVNTNNKCATTDTQCIIAAGDQLIASRQTALTTLSGKVTARENQNQITSDQANVLQSDISTNQSGLAALKSRLDAETDPKAARLDVANIFFQFRIFAVVLPRDYRRLYFDVEVNVDSKLRNLAPSVQQAINKAPAGEQAQLNTLFNDYKNQLSTAESQFDVAQAAFPALTPANFNYNRSTYQATLRNLDTAERTIHNALKQAGSDLHQIAQIIKNQ